MKTKLNREDYQFRSWIIKWIRLSDIQFKNCKIYIGPVQGSIFVRKCENIQISATSSQFRVSNSNNIQCFVYTASDLALEKSTAITFAPYNFPYPSIKDDFEKAKLDPTKNKWSEVYDFTPNADLCNWTLLHPSQFQLVSKSFEDLQNPEQCPCSYIYYIWWNMHQENHFGQLFDGKREYYKQQQLSEVNQAYSETLLKTTDQVKSQPQSVIIQGNYEEFIFDEENVKITEAQIKVQNQNVFDAFNEVSTDNKFNKPNVNISQHDEKILKDQKRQLAQEYLQKFMIDFQKQVNKRKVQNRSIVRKKAQRQEEWKTVIGNIDLKENGVVKDVSKMAQAIKNKLMDRLKIV